MNRSMANPDSTVDGKQTVEFELRAEQDYQQVDTNTQANPQEVEYAIEIVVGHELTPQGLMYLVR